MKVFAEKYLKLLTEDFSTINLTRIEDFDSFYNKQILDSVEPLNKSKVFADSIDQTKILVDVGFGGGFPILPLAKELPGVKFFGFEARGKKASVVKQIAEKLEIHNAILLHQRLEEISFDVPVVITLKAVGKIHEFLDMVNTDQKVRVFFYKGPNYKELENLPLVLRRWNMIEELEYTVDGTEGRYLVGFENKNVPHGTIKNKKLFSSLL
jgi:16S rRNA (guanine527-N7)-methyltransferase